jgi:2',3'-cyclic-nucleotide 2'-phosphodiesterase (5'-nucleotidase family)
MYHVSVLHNVLGGDMAKVTVTEAARLAGIARQHLYRAYINTGKLSIDKDFNGRPVVDTSELLRVFGELKVSHEDDEKRHIKTTDKTNINTVSQNEIDGKDEVITLLRQELEESKAREKEILEKADARELWLRQQLERSQAVLTNQRATVKRRWWWPW